MKPKPQPKPKKEEKEYEFMLTNIPESIFVLLPPPYARNPSRVEFIRQAIREKAEREQKGETK